MMLSVLAERVGVKPDTLRQQINRGKLAAEKFGRDWFVSPDEATRYTRENAVKPGRKPKLTAPDAPKDETP